MTAPARFRRFCKPAMFALAIGGGAVLAPAPAAASVLLWGNTRGLIAEASPGACGGSVGCFVTVAKTVIPATNADTAYAANSNTAYGGANTASAWAKSNYASQRAYAQAYAGYTGGPYPSYAETRADSETYDIIAGPQNLGGLVNVPVTITGSETVTKGIYGASDSLYFQFIVYDLTKGTVLQNFIRHADYAFSSPDSFTISYTSVAGDAISIDSYLEADAYVSSYNYDGGGAHLNVIADFSHTLTYTMHYASGGPDIVGTSGHDYSLPTGAVPEPGTWALLFAGLGMAGAALRRQPRPRLLAG